MDKLLPQLIKVILSLVTKGYAGMVAAAVIAVATLASAIVYCVIRNKQEFNENMEEVKELLGVGVSEGQKESDELDKAEDDFFKG